MTIHLRTTFAFCGAHRVTELLGRDQGLHGHTYTVTPTILVTVPKDVRFADLAQHASVELFGHTEGT